MNKYNYDYFKAHSAIARSCYVLQQIGKEVSPDEFTERFQEDVNYEQVPLGTLIKSVYKYFKNRKLYDA